MNGIDIKASKIEKFLVGCNCHILMENKKKKRKEKPENKEKNKRKTKKHNKKQKNCV